MTCKKPKDFIKKSKELKKQLDEGLSKVDAIAGPSLPSIALIKLRSELGLYKDEFLKLVELVSKPKGDQPPENFNELCGWNA